MSYPSVYDAIGAYMTAAAHVEDVPHYCINQPSSGSVIETTWGRFRIPAFSERDTHGRFLPDLAVCTFEEDNEGEIWLVKLSEEKTVAVRWRDDDWVVID